MKKKLLILAVAAVALASCSNDETVAVNQSDAISFRPVMTNVTRAADVDLAENGFYVTAYSTGTSATPYFDNVLFSYNSSAYSSATKYYWPSGYNLDFYAYSPAEGTDITRTNYKTFNITANATVANQVDFVYANTNNWGKQTGTGTHDGKAGVTINFRHAESKVIIKLKNTNDALTFTVGDVTLGYVANTGTFEYKATTTDTQNSGTLNESGTWTANTGTSGVFTQTVADGSVYSTSTAAQAGADMILIPQTLTTATVYSAASSSSPFNGAYIKVQLKIQNHGEYIIGGTSTFVEALWPIPAGSWEAGKKYIYTVDLAGGGYYPTNQDSSDDLDPIIEGAEIKFITVTVDDWVNVAETNITTS